MPSSSSSSWPWSRSFSKDGAFVPTLSCSKHRLLSSSSSLGTSSTELDVAATGGGGGTTESPSTRRRPQDAVANVCGGGGGGGGGVRADSSDPRLMNLSTVTKGDLDAVITSWGFPRYRSDQVWNWIREGGITDPDQMTNVPRSLRDMLCSYARPSALELASESISRDGTIKRAYRCRDGQIVESVLMPYRDGRYTACISSQAGCAQGCVFCATGQMGFRRQLSSDEIFEQVSRFAAELSQQELDQDEPDGGGGDRNNHDDNKDDKNKKGRRKKKKRKRLSNVVFMGMGEPLANYRNVVGAINRITDDAGIGSRKITVSTVGIVPMIRKFARDGNVPNGVRLAVSLHCATDGERSALLPVNRRYGGLDDLMTSIREYVDVTGQRVTFEWALIRGENDGVESARRLGRLLRRRKYGLRRDMMHVNVIPLNPTGGYAGGKPSDKKRVDAFVKVLTEEYGVACTPRVRRGIDIDAGCGQLTTRLLQEQQQKQEQQELHKQQQAAAAIDEARENGEEVPRGAAEKIDDDEVDRDEDDMAAATTAAMARSDAVVDLDEIDGDDDFDDPVYEGGSAEAKEAERLINLIKGKTISLSSLPSWSDAGDTES